MSLQEPLTGKTSDPTSTVTTSTNIVTKNNGDLKVADMSSRRKLDDSELAVVTVKYLVSYFSPKPELRDRYDIPPADPNLSENERNDRKLVLDIMTVRGVSLYVAETSKIMRKYDEMTEAEQEADTSLDDLDVEACISPIYDDLEVKTSIFYMRVTHWLSQRVMLNASQAHRLTEWVMFDHKRPYWAPIALYAGLTCWLAVAHMFLQTPS